MNNRLLAALVVGGLVGAGCALYLLPFGHAADFTWALRGARDLWAGLDPYHNPLLSRENPYPYDNVLFYPVPALLIVLPLAWLPDPFAAGVFVGVSTTALAYAYPEYFLIFLSAPFIVAVFYAQWSPLLTAATAMPALGFVLAAKPSIGAALWASRPSRQALVGIVAIGIVSLVVAPGWPSGWLENVRQGRHVSPIVQFPPIVLGCALALARRTDRRIWTLLLLAMVPQFAGSLYDHLPIYTLMRNRRQLLILAISSWIGLGVAVWLRWEWTLSASTYGTALVLIWIDPPPSNRPPIV
jgi:hypothetical protein